MLLPKKNVGLRPFPPNYSSLILFRHWNLTFFAESNQVEPTCPLKRAQLKYVLIFSFSLLSLMLFFLGYYVVSMWVGRLWKHFPPPPPKKKKKNLPEELLSLSRSLWSILKLLSQTSQRYFKSLKHMLYAFDHSL